MTTVITSGAPRTNPELDVAQAARFTAAVPDELELREGADPALLPEVLAHVDNSTLLFAAQIILRDNQIELGKEGVSAQKDETERLFKQIQKAIKDALDAAHKKGFWGKISDKFGVVVKIAAVVAAVASAAFTGGASILALVALAGTLLSTFSKELSFGNEKLQQAFAYGGAALSVAAGGLGLLSSATSGTAAAVSAGSTLGRLASVTYTTATWVQVGGTLGMASTGVARDVYAAEEVGARADETESRTDRTAALREMDQLIEFLKNVDQSFTRMTKTLVQTMNQHAEGQLALANLGARA